MEHCSSKAGHMIAHVLSHQVVNQRGSKQIGVTSDQSKLVTLMVKVYQDFNFEHLHEG